MPALVAFQPRRQAGVSVPDRLEERHVDFEANMTRGKTTPAGFRVVRSRQVSEAGTAEDSTSSSSLSESSEEDLQEGNPSSGSFDPQALIDNDMRIFAPGRMTVTRRDKPKLERVLTAKNNDVTEEENEGGQWRRSLVSLRRGSTASLDEDLQTVLDLFQPGDEKRWKTYHSALDIVVKHIFGLDDVSLTIKRHSTVGSRQRSNRYVWSLAFSGRPPAALYQLQDMLASMRTGAHSLVSSNLFMGFFHVLTIYVLLGPDIVPLVTSQEQDSIFYGINTTIFFLFILELLLLMCANEHYSCTAQFLLDVVSIYALCNYTWLVEGFSDDVAEVEKLDTQSRFARLIRIARLARVTRLIPTILSLFKNKKVLAKRILQRRLRRAFQFMDTDQRGMLSSFDVKCFYFSVLHECPQMLGDSRVRILHADKEQLTKMGASGAEDEQVNWITPDDFERILLGTALGKDVQNHHLQDVENQRGVWTLTSKLSDRTALKVSVGILILIILLNLTDVHVEEASVTQNLAHLHSLARRERQHGHNVSLLCEHVRIFAEEFVVLFLHLDGHTFFENSAANASTCFSDLSLRVGELHDEMWATIRNSNVRDSDLVQACFPDHEGCARATTVSMALVDESDRVRKVLLWTMISQMVVLVIIVAFIVIFHIGTNHFTRTIVYPLRALVDDMMAMSSIDLVHIDAEEESLEMLHGNSKQGEELANLQNAFKSMQKAIRSWTRYVPPSVVQKLFTNGVEAVVGVNRVTASILFVDVDGFEESCGDLSPTEVNNTLASMLQTVATVIHANKGTLLEFIGDEVLAVFNTPNAVKAHVWSAVASVIQIHEGIAKLGKIYTEDGREVPIRCRCGVHTASVLAGNIGSHRRMKFGVLGDGVNLSARLKSLNSRYGTQSLASDTIFEDDQCKKKVLFRPVDRCVVKGRSEPTTVYEVLGFKKSEGAPAPNLKSLKEAAQKSTEAHRLYQGREFEKAEALFEEVAIIMEAMQHCTLYRTGTDEPSRQLIVRCHRYRIHPPPPGWDGAEHLKAKTFEAQQLAPPPPSEPSLSRPVGQAIGSEDGPVADEALMPLEALQVHTVAFDEKSEVGSVESGSSTSHQHWVSRGLCPVPCANSPKDGSSQAPPYRTVWHC